MCLLKAMVICYTVGYKHDTLTFFESCVSAEERKRVVNFYCHTGRYSLTHLAQIDAVFPSVAAIYWLYDELYEETLT